MSFRGVPRYLQNKVRAYYEYLWVSGQANHHRRAFDELPPMLQMQISLFLKRAMIESCSVFTNLTPSSVVAIMNRLEETIAIPNEVIILQGSVGDKMFFITNGIVFVKLQKPDGTTIKLAEMNRGAAFGEMGVLDDGSVRTCSIVAKVSAAAAGGVKRRRDERRGLASLKHSHQHTTTHYISSTPQTFCELDVLNKDDIDNIRAECADVDENLHAILAVRHAADKAREKSEKNITNALSGMKEENEEDEEDEKDENE